MLCSDQSAGVKEVKPVVGGGSKKTKAKGAPGKKGGAGVSGR